MNKRIDYKFKELVLRMLLMIAIKIGCPSDELSQEVIETYRECEAISDGRQQI